MGRRWVRWVRSKVGRKTRGPRVRDPQQFRQEARCDREATLEVQLCCGSQSRAPGRHFRIPLGGGCVFTGALNAAITRALVPMRSLLRWLTVPALLTLAACVSSSPLQTRRAPDDLPGLRADGSVLLPNQCAW